MRQDSENSRLLQSSIQTRIGQLLLVMTLLSAILVAKAAFLAWQGSKSRAQTRHEELCIPGLRGSIYSHEGELLAWSERRLSLCWRLPDKLDEAQAQAQQIAALNLPLPLETARLSEQLGKVLVLDEDFPLSAMQKALPQLENGALFVKMRLQRCYSEIGSWRNRLGKVEIDEHSGLELGVSGLELQYEPRLRASLMRYAISRKGGALSRLFDRMLSNSGNGGDVVLPRKSGAAE
ncbi:MAG: hypothetical protein PHG44_08165 [Lentisphaeria bacterium]|jgi:cell division protein FtsI/penicillin-binding protein 2|nr:hypothetical protein [Lentisphaeria bacterium]MDY0175395.1 hypothetical protein [Lentisphaeria bacterium]NLZ60159.1 hypothetical protein [Lentisphaerota bacterium]